MIRQNLNARFLPKALSAVLLTTALVFTGCSGKDKREDEQNYSAITESDQEAGKASQEKSVEITQDTQHGQVPNHGNVQSFSQDPNNPGFYPNYDQQAGTVGSRP